MKHPDFIPQKTSQQREGTGQSRKQPLRAERDAIELAGLEHGLANLNDGLPLSSRLLREIHDQLLARGRGADRLPGPTSGGVPVQPELDRRHQSGECALRAAAAGAPCRLHDAAGAVHPWRPPGPAADRADADRGRGAPAAVALHQPVLHAAPQPLLRAAGSRTPAGRLGSLARVGPCASGRSPAPSSSWS